MKHIVLPLALLLCSCTLAIKNNTSITGGHTQELSFTVAPLVSITKEVTKDTAKTKMFAVAPIPEKSATTTTTTTTGSNTKVVKEEERKEL